jgi:TRAP-type C4-dicarboxylate transport system substrate-binding protein
MKLVVVLVIALLTSCTPAPPAGVTVLTYASPYSPAHPFSRADKTWMTWIETQSHGAIKIQPYWSGSLLSSEQSMTELRHGVVDIGLITPIYARGGTHLIRVQAGFYGGVTTFAQQVALYRCIVAAEPQFDRELHDLVVLAVQGGNLPGILTRNKPVRSLADLQGLRLRAPAELLALLKYFGADPVDMPMGEVYSALAKGVLDGVVAPLDSLKSLHFAEVAHYFNTLPVPRGAYAARAMGVKRWNSLSVEQQSLLTQSSAVWEAALAEELLKANHAGEQVGHEQGLEFIAMPANDTQRFLETYNQFAERGAQSLTRFDIDGMASFKHARTIATRMNAHVGNGETSCIGEAP